MHLPERIGKYEVVELLGKGGVGVVYKAFDPSIARSVAIKAITKDSLPPGELKNVMDRFRREAQAVGRLVHPRIVQIYDYGEDEEVAYIVMELVNGKTLHEHLAQEARYEIKEVGEIVRQVLDGIGYAHSQGVVHRDIKTSNIMINSDGRIKISDFGIARLDFSDLTQVGEVLGTPHYMAPEQFLGSGIDKPADLYSIGVIAYELLAGRRPFLGTTASIMQQALNERPLDPSRLNPRLSPLVDRVLQKALAKKSEERFQSAQEFADAFKEALAATTAPHYAEPTMRLSAPEGSALLDAARLLGTAAAPDLSRTQPPVLSSEGTIGLDTSVKQARLLLIDDEERILTALKSLFRERYHVFATTDGTKALDFIRRHHMHVIVSDQRMPGMSGVELLRQSRDISPRSVRILLTGYSDLASIVGSINDGEIYRFISKPWDNQELATTIGEAATIALELADTHSAAAELPQTMEAGILVIDSNEEIFRVTRELVGNLCPVVYAADLDAGLAAMHAHEIAVVVTDVEARHEELTAMLKLLKQEDPGVLTIVVTTASDAELVIELINEAQIFRFLNKPVNVHLLKKHVRAALQRYLSYKATPKLVEAHRVGPAEPVRASSLGQHILEGIRTMRGRWLGEG